MPTDNPLELFLSINLDEKTARNTIANNKVTNNLVSVIHEAGVVNGCDRNTGNLLYAVATRFPASSLVHRPKLLDYIVSSKIKTTAQLEAALSFFSKTGSEKFEVSEFENACGVGIELSTEDIEKAVNEVFDENKFVILEQRYRTKGRSSHGLIQRLLRKLLRKNYASYLVKELQWMMKSL